MPSQRMFAAVQLACGPCLLSVAGDVIVRLHNILHILEGCARSVMAAVLTVKDHVSFLLSGIRRFKETFWRLRE